jgi:hypothetical protein
MIELRSCTKVAALSLAGAIASTGLVACGSDSGSAGAQQDGPAAVRGAYAKTTAAKGARMTLKTQSTASGQSLTANGDGVIDFVSGNSRTTMTSQGQKVQQRVISGVLYQQVPAEQRARTSGNKPWIKIDLKKIAEQSGQSASALTDPAQSASYLKAVSDKDVKKAGTAKIGGADTTRYKVNVDVAKLAAQGGSDPAKLEQQLGKTLPVNVWLDSAGRIRREQIDMKVNSAGSAAAAKVSTVIEFSDFGANADVKAPAAKDTSDMTGKATGVTTS